MALAARRRPARQFRLSRRGRALVVLGAASALLAYPAGRVELLFLGCLLVVLPVLALVSVRLRRQRFTVQRRFLPSVATVGNPVSVRLALHDLAGAASRAARWRDEWPWAPYGTARTPLRATPVRRSAAANRRARRLEYTLLPPRRGVFELGPLMVDFNDPFGLAEGELTLGEPSRLVVAPALVALPVAGPSAAADDGSARVAQRRIAGGDDEHMTREYRSGDPLRRVHWRASAHRGELMVRQEDQRSHAQARILLDTTLAGYRVPVSDDREPGEVQSAAFEWALRFCGSLALHLQTVGFTVRILETGFRQLAQPRHIDEFLESLAGIRLVAGHASATGSLHPQPGRMPGSAFAVIGDAEPQLLDRLAAQRARFDSAFAIVVDARSDAAVTRLHKAGWLCVSARSTDDLADAWLAVAEAKDADYARA